MSQLSYPSAVQADAVRFEVGPGATLAANADERLPLPQAAGIILILSISLWAGIAVLVHLLVS